MSESTLRIILIIALVIVVLAAIVVAIVWWRRKRAAAAPPRASGPAIGEQLRKLWQPFYRHIPARALHFPTIVVVGDAGVGKTHSVGCHVDWRGQSHQFLPSVDHGAALQLYLGPEVVVHELSAPLLHDVSGDAKRALQTLWRNMGPSATLVLALDARTLLTTPPAALRELAQLVRGKIGLFPARCRASTEVRVYLGHLDQIEGYEEFAAAIGSSHGPLELDPSGEGPSDAERLVEAFDAHLAHALTHRSGEEFDRMVGFYAVLPKLIAGLTPLLEGLRGKDEPFADRHPARRLYLGSSVPRSHVGNPYKVDSSQIAGSLRRQRRRGLRGGLVLATSLSAVAGGLLYWHAQRIEAAADEVEKFRQLAVFDADGGDLDDNEEAATEAVARAFSAMHDSEILWFERTFEADKREIDRDFEAAIRTAYLEPRLTRDDADRVELLYVTTLIYASRDNELGELIDANLSTWAAELDEPGIHLSERVITSYIQSSREPYAGTVLYPAGIEQGGREWPDYLAELDAALHDHTIAPEEAERLRSDLPELRGLHHYEVLAKLLKIVQGDPLLGDRLAPLLSQRYDAWTIRNHDALADLRATIEQLVVEPALTKSWGLARLVRELERLPSVKSKPYAVEFEQLRIDSEVLDAAIMRSRRHELIADVLDRLALDLPEGGRAFFSKDAHFRDAGLVKGYGEGPTGKISGFYTKAAFDAQVAPVLAFASARASEGSTPEASEPSDEPSLDAEPAPASAPLELTREDQAQLDAAIRNATKAYADAYHQELILYYDSFEFHPDSEVTLPFAIKAFAQPSSWFTDFLLAVSRNAALELPEQDPGEYYEPMKQALDDFGPLITLLAEEGGELPGLAPYQALLSNLQQQVVVAVALTGDPMAEELGGRLSGLGGMALRVAQGTERDSSELVEGWLFESGLDRRWFDPFMAPTRSVRRLAFADLDAKLASAWRYDVRKLVDPLLGQYPFDPSMREEASIDDIEAIVRQQGEAPGSFWEAFERLIRPAMKQEGLVMLAGVVAPSGMLAMAHDLERTSGLLWDAKGERKPLEVVIEIDALPTELFDGRAASMASISSGSASIFGFNQRPEPQTMAIEWWNQDTSVVLLKMTAPESNGRDESRYRLVTSGTFSFYRLLDQGLSRDFGKQVTPTEVAITRATRCDRRGPSGTRGMKMSWPVALDSSGKQVRSVSVVIVSDPWAAFAVRSCL